MASKSIDIKIASHFNANGVLEANEGLAKLAQDVKGVNDEMRKATMRAEMAVNSYAAQADKATRAMGGGYKTLEQQLAELATAHRTAGTEAVAAGNAATKSAIGLEMAMGLARGSTEQVSKALAMLSQRIPILGKIGVAACGAWAAAVMGVVKAFSAAKELAETAFNLNKVPQEISDASAAMLDLNNATERFRTAMGEAREAGKSQLKTFEAEADAINRVTKAQIELNRQRSLAAAKTEEERAAVNTGAESASATADEENAQLKRDARRNELLKEQSRLQSEINEADRTISRSREIFGMGMGAEDVALDAVAAKDDAKRKLEDNRAAIDLLEREEEAAELLIDARKQKEENAAAEVARKKADEEKKLADEKSKAEAEAAKKAEAERLKEVEAERKAREKMEADLHAQRVKNAQAEVKASEDAATVKQNAISNAQTEFDRAFAMYRSEDKGAAQIAEERDYAADYKRLQKDAARYGGKWRIDELSSLIAAGDTAGQAAKLEEWRKSSRFTPEVESMVRAAAADQTRTTAEDELRKISANTDGLAKKLDELLAMKG